MTSAAPEPTDEQRQVARRLVDQASVARTANDYEGSADAIARALAAAVAAEREKYLRVAGQLEGDVERLSVAANVLTADGKLSAAAEKTRKSEGMSYAARRIREVSR